MPQCVCPRGTAAPQPQTGSLQQQPRGLTSLHAPAWCVPLMLSWSAALSVALVHALFSPAPHPATHLLGALALHKRRPDGGQVEAVEAVCEGSACTHRGGQDRHVEMQPCQVRLETLLFGCLCQQRAPGVYPARNCRDRCGPASNRPQTRIAGAACRATGARIKALGRVLSLPPRAPKPTSRALQAHAVIWPSVPVHVGAVGLCRHRQEVVPRPRHRQVMRRKHVAPVVHLHADR